MKKVQPFILFQFQAKLQENIEKCNETEAACAANEDGRRAGEARSFAAEQSLEAMETELEEANAVATASNHKFEDVTRKLKVVEGKYGALFCGTNTRFNPS